MAALSVACTTTADCWVVGAVPSCDCAPSLAPTCEGVPVNGVAFRASAAGALADRWYQCCLCSDAGASAPPLDAPRDVSGGAG
ncbi:MAG TPA: hypothetical protein VGQ83_10080 [Polyangia bacterium]